MIAVHAVVLDLDIFEEFFGKRAELTPRDLNRVFEPESMRYIRLMLDTGATLSFLLEEKVHGLYYEVTGMRVVRTAGGISVYPEIRTAICVRVNDLYKCGVTKALILPMNLDAFLIKHKKLEKEFAMILEKLEREGLIESRKEFIKELKGDYRETRAGFVDVDGLLGLRSMRDITLTTIFPV